MVIFFFICKQKAIIAQALIIAVYLVEHSLHSRIMSTVRSKMLSISLSGLHLVKTFAVIIFLSNRCFAQEVDPVPPNNIAINGAYISLTSMPREAQRLDAILVGVCYNALIFAQRVQNAPPLITKF